MSVFGFTDTPPLNSGNGDESLFSFTDEPVEEGGNVSEFSFGASEDSPVAPSFGTALGEPPRQPVSDLFEGTDKSASQGKKPVKKKAASRVIGLKKKAAASKKPKFAKGSPGASSGSGSKAGGGLFSKSSFGKGSSMSSDVHESEASESDNPFAHEGDVNSDVHEHQPSNLESLLAQQEPPQFYTQEANQNNQQQQNESVFSFGTNEAQQQQQNEAAFSFESGETQNNESAFAFGSGEAQQATTETEAGAESMFSFGNNEATNDSYEAPKQEIPTYPKFSSDYQQLPSSKNQVSEEAPIDSDLDEDCTAFVRQLAKFKRELEMAQNSYDKCKNSLTEMERQQSEALKNEQFDMADQLNNQINKMKTQMLMSQSGFNKTIADAMTLTNEAPQHFLTHANAAQQELPTLRVRKQALDKRLSNLKEDQQVDKQTIEIERKKNASLIESLKKPIEEHQESHKIMEIELKAQIENAKQPFIDSLGELQKQKTSHEERIEELKKEILLHQNEINDIKKKIVANQKQMKAAEDSFNGDQRNVIEDKAKLEKESDDLKRKIKEIEAPFQSLVDTVDKRETEINGISTAIEKISQQIDDGEKDSNGCESAAKIVNKLCQEHYLYSEQRTASRNRFDVAIKSARDSETRRNEINDDAIELRGRCQRASEFLNNAKLKVPQLEASKKAAVASKNFKGAQQINKELTSINEQISVNEKMVAEGTQQLEKLEAEASTLTTDIAKAQVEVEESKMSLLQLDYNFFTNATEVMEKLIEISPFGAKLLNPLINIIDFALEHTEVPKQMSLDELQEELDKLTQEQENAVNDEDFDTAAQIQEKIDTLQAKLELCKSQERVVENQ